MIAKAYQQHKVELIPTSADIEGPFFKAGAPFRDHLVDDPAPLHLSGGVFGTDGQPIVGAVLDFWQANPEGEYDNDGFNFRGKVRSSEEGRYELYTVRPGDYEIGGGEFRCAHIHVKVTAPGVAPLTTQMYFDGAPHNETDHWFDPKRVINGQNQFNFVLARVS